MAYSYEKNSNGEYDLVINGFEAGIADSPFDGISNIRNLNISYMNGVSYVNYKRQACTMSGGTLGTPMYATKSPAGTIYISDSSKQIWKQSAVNSTTFNLLTGRSNTSEVINGIQFWNNYLVVFEENVVEICGTGTGDSGITSGAWNTAAATTGVWPIKGTTVTLTGAPTTGDTTGTISSYTDAQGNSRAFWNGPTGTYFFNFSITGIGAQTVIARLVQGSTSVSWTPALNGPSASSDVGCTGLDTNVTRVGGGTHMSITSINDGNLYFCHSPYVGSMQAIPFQTVNKGDMKTFTYNVAALGLPKDDGAIWLTEVRNQLLIAGNQKVYPWDRISPQWLNPIPVYENISKMTNILNDVYILAGSKGNIYISNGFNAEPFKKLPDHLSGVIDPQWTFGGIMEHRNKLFFEATATNSSTGTNIFAGVFRLDVKTKALTIDSQYSGGLLPTGLTTTGGVLVNNSNLSSLAYDNYYSGYGATTSSIDYNSTTLWSGDEGYLESDIIPIGTAIQPKTYTSAEFKLDQPMQSGDSISLYARQSLSDSYVLLGTTTSAVLSEFYPNVSFENWQWLQVKALMTCNSAVGSSSRVQLREIRMR